MSKLVAFSVQKQDLSHVQFPQIDPEKLGFGKFFGPLQLTMDWQEKTGWSNPRIEELKPLNLHPAASVLQYAQTVFEGLKAFHGVDGRIRLFRPGFHADRFCKTSERVCLPTLPEGWFEEATRQIVLANQKLIPQSPGCSLYLRPTLFGSESFLGVRPSKAARLVYLTSPVGPYYQSGRQQLKIMVERQDVRAAAGGLGFAKTGANYAASLRAGARAQAAGFDQVLWLDACERQAIEEVGTMNIFFVIGDEVVTPKLNGSILAGCTRDSALHLLKIWGFRVSERKITWNELLQAADKGLLKEAFGTGTAAVIAPVGEFTSVEDQKHVKLSGPMPVAQRLYDEITGLQTGLKQDPFGWVEILSLAP